VTTNPVSRVWRTAQGLRGRLALFFVAIVVIPLLIGLLSIAGQIRQGRQLQDVRTVEQSADAISRVLSESSEALNVVVDSLSTEDTGDALARGETAALDDQLERIFGSATGVVDFIVAADRDGEVVAEAGREPDIAEGARFADFADIGQAATRQEGVAGAIVAGRILTTEDGQRLGFLAAGNWVDAEELGQLPTPLLGGAATLAGEAIWASNQGASSLDPATLDDSGVPLRARTDNGESLIVRQVEGVNIGGARLVVWGPDDSAFDLMQVVTSIILPTAAVAAVAGWLLAGTVVAPIGRAVAAARSVAAGHLDRKMPVGGGGRELNDLGHALNTMSDQLSQRVAELERSRDELRGSLSRLGETLSSSLDLDRTLAVVTETAMDTLAADRAVLMLFTPERDALYAKVGRGVGDTVPRLRPGQGRLGWVAVEGMAARVGDPLSPRGPTNRPGVSDMPDAPDALDVPAAAEDEPTLA
jgi:HAMP domain-containing protein